MTQHDAARFDYWLKRNQWTVRELAYLLKGKEPPDILDWDIAESESKDFQQFYADFQSLSQDIAYTYQLDPIQKSPEPFEITYKPVELLDWFKSKGYAIPNALLPLLKKKGRC